MHEQHADAVADAVVQRKSAEGLLDQYPDGIKSGMRVQRQAPQAGNAAAWPGGPTVARKSTTHSLAEYVGWLRQVEAKYGAGRAETLQRLRRLYYSQVTGGAGPRFDAVIAAAPGAGGAPMTTLDLPVPVINSLYETNAIATPNGSLIDVSHILAGIDVHVESVGLKAGVAEARFGVNFEGVLTWVGDLASWFVEAKNAVAKRGGATVSHSDQVAILLGLANSKAAKDDLLGDVDAQVMADRFTTTTTYPTFSSGAPVIQTSQDMPLSAMLSQYYGREQSPAGAAASGGPAPQGPKGSAGGATRTATSESRFHYFVVGARPAIPHTLVAANPLTVALASDAPAKIREHISNTAHLFIDQSYTGGTPTDLVAYAALLDEVNTRFVRFLTTGLTTGDAPWP